MLRKAEYSNAQMFLFLDYSGVVVCIQCNTIHKDLVVVVDNKPIVTLDQLVQLQS